MAEGILVALLIVPLILTFLLRANAALAFLALCTGFTAATYASGSTQHWLAHLASSGQLLSTNAINLIMITAPLLITLLLTRKHVPKKRFYLQAVPALAGGGLLALSTAPLLTDWLNTNFSSVSLWNQLQKQEAIIVGVGALASLLIIWLTTSKPQTKKHK
jgi:MFS family permease